jgi:hypothetical protein
MVSDEGNRFQTIAVIRAQQKWPRLIACERKWDGGLDAHADGALEPDGRGLGLACSTTATIKKIKSDAAKTKEHYPDVRVLIFATTGKVTEHTSPTSSICCSRSFRAKSLLFGFSIQRTPTSAEISWESHLRSRLI